MRRDSVEIMQHNLVHIRKSLKLSCKEFGNMIGVTRQQINNLETGHSKLTVSSYLAILYVLEKEIYPKLNYEEEMCIRDMCNRKVITADYKKSLIFEKEGKS